MPRDRFYFYELAVTNAPMLARFCRAVAGKSATTLREDFSGTGALANAWLDLSPDHQAIIVDQDRTPLARSPRRDRLRAIRASVLSAHAEADLIAATNFPLGYWHTRDELIKYLRHARSCLNPRGVFLCDLYGGASAFQAGTTTRRFREPDGTPFTYEWEQRRADPVTGLVENAIHFRVRSASGSIKRLLNAFTYHWRLWSIPELSDALRDAGFRRIEVHNRLGDAVDSDGNLYPCPLSPGDPLDADWVVYLVAR